MRPSYEAALVYGYFVLGGIDEVTVTFGCDMRKRASTPASGLTASPKRLRKA